MAAVPELRRDLQLVEGYHSPQIGAAVRLNTNESPLGPPARWQEEVAEEIGTLEFNRYPDRDARLLREAIGELHGVGPRTVFAAKGSNEVIQCLLLAFGGQGRKVAVFEPTYLLHSHIARITGTRVVAAQRDSAFGLDLDGVRTLLGAESPEVTFLCSPNNPTGGAESRETVEAVVEAAAGLVVVDEAYGQFASWSALEILKEGVEGLVVIRTFSKTWAMAGCRLGYLVGPDAVVRACESVALPYHLDSFSQAAGLRALEFVPEMNRRVAMIVEERERIQAALAVLEVDFWASQANFVLFRPRRRPGREVWEALLERSVLIRNCDSWPGLDGCLRVTVGTPDENEAFLVALGEVLK